MDNGLSQITLENADGKKASFKCGVRKTDGLLFMRPQWRDRGFGDSHSKYVEFEMVNGNSINVSADIWRFFEGTLGVATLFHFLNRENGWDAFLGFVKEFKQTGDDDKALELWNKTVKDTPWLSDDILANSMYIGSISPARLRHLAAFLDHEFSNLKALKTLRVNLLDAALKTGQQFGPV